MTWERYDRTMPVSAHRIELTIRKHGDMALSIGAYEALGKPPFVALLHDFAENRRLIALRAEPEETETGFKVCAYAKGRPIIVARTFVRFLEIETDTATTWQASMVGDEDTGPLLVADLSTKGIIATRGQGNRHDRPVSTTAVYRCHEKGCREDEWSTVERLSTHTRREHHRPPSVGERAAVQRRRAELDSGGPS